jgi:uncharacterized protein YecE (DUF72 family)
MKYGKLDNVDDIDFVLPKSDTGVLSGVPSSCDIRMGGTMFNLPQWVGKVFPPKTKAKDFLFHYSRQFNTIEFNATHYRMPSSESVSRWRDQTPEGFLFCPKFPQSISHYRRFKDCNQLTDEFLTAILSFESRLGTSFIQLPPHYGADKFESLAAYLLGLPRDVSFAIEFRHPSWFEQNTQSQEMWHLLEECGISAVVSDTAGRRDALHMRITTPKVFVLRFGGNNLHASDFPRLDSWVNLAAEWEKQGLKSFHLWMHQTDSILTPETCIYFAQQLQKKTGRSISVPQLYPQNLSLF